MFRPLDLLVRVTAIPSIAWSASGAILDTRHRIADALAGDPDSPTVTRMLDGLFDRIEEQCRARWCDAFGCDPADETESRAA